MATSFQILPTANRPTASDAIGNFIDTIQQRQAVAQKMAAIQSMQQQQAASDAQDRQNDLEDAARERANDLADTAQDQQNDVLNNQVSQFNAMDANEKKAVFPSLSPEVQRRVGYNPALLPAEQPEGPKPMTQYESARLKLEQQKAAQATQNSQPDLPNFADPTQPNFKEHPAVKDYNDKLRTLSGIEQKLVSGGLTVADPQTGKQRPMTPQEITERHAALRKTIQNLVNQRSAAVKNLRSAGVKVAQAPDDTTYVGKGGAGKVGPAPVPDEPEPDEPDNDADEQPQGGKPLDAQTAVQFLHQAGGDNNKARALAQAAGYAIQ
jgi:hypothetical protein